VSWFRPYSLQPAQVLPPEWVGFSPDESFMQLPYVDADTGWLMIGCGIQHVPDHLLNVNTSELTWPDGGSPDGPWYPFTDSGAFIKWRMTNSYSADQGLVVTAFEDPYYGHAPTNNSLALGLSPDAHTWSLYWNLYDSDYHYVDSGSVEGIFDAGEADAWFRLRWDADLIGIADVSTDGTTWTELGRSDRAVPVTLGIVQMGSYAGGSTDGTGYAHIKDLWITGRAGGYQVAVDGAWVAVNHKVAAVVDLDGTGYWFPDTYTVL
jgi:hypothetical protein